MVNSIIALDSEDSSLGQFFSICSKIVSDVINETGGGEWSFLEMQTRALNEINLELKVSQFKGKNFIFSSFTHGSEDAIYSNGSRFVYTPCDPNYLTNAIVFCFACSSGRQLGATLVDTGTLSFIGYNKDVAIWSTYMHLFAECACEAIRAFYNGKSVKQSLSSKTAKYNTEIDNIYLKNFPVAALLMDNRDALVLHGDDSLTIANFTGFYDS